MKRAFSLIELVVVIGVIAVLIGLALPAVQNARHKARLTKSAEMVRHTGLAVQMYTQQSREVFPLSATNVQQCQQTWASALVKAGIYESEREMDPDAFKAIGKRSVEITMGTYMRDEQMMPGNPRGMDVEPTAARTTGELKFPSLKGLVLQVFSYYTPYRKYGMPVLGWTEDWTSFCCVPTSDIPTPVVFADGSVEIGTWQRFSRTGAVLFDPSVPGPALYLEQPLGLPVWSPWGGLSARDR